MAITYGPHWLNDFEFTRRAEGTVPGEDPMGAWRKATEDVMRSMDENARKTESVMQWIAADINRAIEEDIAAVFAQTTASGHPPGQVERNDAAAGLDGLRALNRMTVRETLDQFDRDVRAAVHGRAPWAKVVTDRIGRPGDPYLTAWVDFGHGVSFEFLCYRDTIFGLDALDLKQQVDESLAKYGSKLGARQMGRK